MRTQTFLETLGAHYVAAEAEKLSSVPGINGGWEVWLQVEIAKTFFALDDTWTFNREQAYENPLNGPVPWIAYNKQTKIATYTQQKNSASKSDFSMLHAGGRDLTYLELKCINPNLRNAINDAWTRYRADISKIIGITKLDASINGIALLATYGTFKDIPVFPVTMKVFVWDPYEGTARYGVSAMKDVKLYGNDRFFLIGCSVN